ncbi:MAG: hypothetical protein J2P37_25490 [Ktedonobacteraceae bacterium]|nr:hypothetical protein [Ktedonobacteraceae bacterium]
MLLASVLILWGPVCLLQSTFIPANTLWGGLMAGGLLFAMGLIALLAPSQTQTAGAAGIILALVSLLTALGGLGMGMLLGVFGSSYVLAWKPGRTIKKSPTFWAVFGGSIVTALYLVSLITRGGLAVAAPIVGPFTTFIGRLECHDVHSTPVISQVDHRTVVTLTHSEYCQASHIVITQRVFGRTITITQAEHAPAILRGVTTEVMRSHAETVQNSHQKVTNLDGTEQTVQVSIQTNLTSEDLLQITESATIPDVTVSSGERI